MKRDWAVCPSSPDHSVCSVHCLYEIRHRRHATRQWSIEGQGERAPSSALSLGLWHNFGREADERRLSMIETAFDRGITHFDLANNYGPRRKREDALERSSKIASPLSRRAGHLHQGRLPDGDAPTGSGEAASTWWQALIRASSASAWSMWTSSTTTAPIPTPLEETAAALSHLVRQGKALHGHLKL